MELERVRARQRLRGREGGGTMQKQGQREGASISSCCRTSVQRYKFRVKDSPHAHHTRTVDSDLQYEGHVPSAHFGNQPARTTVRTLDGILHNPVWNISRNCTRGHALPLAKAVLLAALELRSVHGICDGSQQKESKRCKNACNSGGNGPPPHGSYAIGDPVD